MRNKIHDLCAFMAASLLMTTGSARAAVNFQDYYAPANWTIIQDNSDGSVITSGAPGQIQIIGPNNGGESPGSTRYTIIAPDTGTVSFHWSYGSGTDTDGYDSSGYYVNGTFTEIAVTSGTRVYTSGDTSFPVISGDTFGFYAASDDNLFGAGDLTVTSFTAPSPVPEPTHIALSIFGLVVGSVSLGRRLCRKFRS